MPPWVVQNCFDCLTVEQCNETPPTLEVISVVPSELPDPTPLTAPPTLPPKPPTPLVEFLQGHRPPPSEKCIPRQLYLAANNLRHLSILVELELPHTHAKLVAPAMIDSGATNIGFIDRDFVAKSGFLTWKLFQPQPVFNVDGTPNSAGSITHVIDIVLCYRDHSKQLQFAKGHPQAWMASLTQSQSRLGYWRHEALPLSCRLHHLHLHQPC